MSAEQHGAAGASRKVGDHVHGARPPADGGHHDVDAHGSPLRRAGQLPAERRGDAEHGDADAGPDESREHGRRAARCALVGDEHGARSGGPRVAGLLEHEAGPAAHERDGAARERGEGRAGAAARRGVGLDGRDAGRDPSAAGVLQRHEVLSAAVALGAGGQALEAGRPGLSEQVVREAVESRLVAGRAQPAGHIGAKARW